MEEEITITKNLKEIKKNLKTDKLVIGTDTTLKLLKQDKIEKVFLSGNTPKEVEEDFNYYSKITGTEVNRLNLPNYELGTFCKKPFPISVLGFKK
jgi:large subunit ribosomal protein L30e